MSLNRVESFENELFVFVRDPYSRVFHGKQISFTFYPTRDIHVSVIRPLRLQSRCE